MIYSVKIPPYTPHETVVKGNISNNFSEYNLFTIGKESYIISGTVENSDEVQCYTRRIIHNLHIGKYCSIAPDFYVLLGRGKNYKKVTTSAAKVLNTAKCTGMRHHEKGSVIIENDVWIGRKVSVMSGVTIHNGAVVAALSHVVKDVPPYAIVGGNPAKVIGYRFGQEVIDKLQTIQWWNWSDEKLEQNAEFFNDDIDTFCEKFYEEAKEEVEMVCQNTKKEFGDIYFMLLDNEDEYSVLEFVLDEFICKWCQDGKKKLELFLLEQDGTSKKYAEGLQRIIDGLYQEHQLKCEISLQMGTMEDIKRRIANVKHIVINRNPQTMQLIDYARKYGGDIEIISGVDEPIFY